MIEVAGKVFGEVAKASFGQIIYLWLTDFEPISDVFQSSWLTFPKYDLTLLLYTLSM